MLKQRVITALILAPLVLGLVFFATPELYAGALAAIALLAALEWARLAALAPLPRALLMVMLIAGMWMAYSRPESRVTVLIASVAVWLALFVAVFLFPRATSTWDRPWRLFFAGFWILAGTFTALLALRDLRAGAWWVVACLFVIWAADIGAYFVGRGFGKRRLAPAISPGKTWEGVAGGMLLAVITLIALIVLTPLGADLSVFAGIVLALAGAAVSVLGDLVESMLKRRRGVKDSGALLPGHGGLLDRIDSLIAVAPFAAGWLLLVGVSK